MNTYPFKVIILLVVFWIPFSAYAEKNILVFGDSLSAGYGIALEESWPYLLQLELRRTQSDFQVINASISGETTSGGLRRIGDALQQHKPAVVIVELGANDGLRGYPNKDTQSNLSKIIDLSQKNNARVLLAGMQLPPNYGQTYTTQFHNIFTNLSKKHRILLLPFLLEGVTPEQFLPDNLHPTAGAQQRIMLNVLQELKHLLH
ncbi:MAG: arylesterase [Gallionella sp.]